MLFVAEDDAASVAASACWGLHCVSRALAFINSDCKLVHGNVCRDSVFVSKVRCGSSGNSYRRRQQAVLPQRRAAAVARIRVQSCARSAAAALYFRMPLQQAAVLRPFPDVCSSVLCCALLLCCSALNRAVCEQSGDWFLAGFEMMTAVSASASDWPSAAFRENDGAIDTKCVPVG